MAPIAAVAVGAAVDVVKAWIKKKFPDPQDQRKAEMEFEEFAHNKDMAEVQQFYTFMESYEGAAKDVDPHLQVYRGSVRPTITYFLIICYVLGIINNWPEQQMYNLYVLNIISLGFWYGERAFKNLGLDLGKFKNKQ